MSYIYGIKVEVSSEQFTVYSNSVTTQYPVENAGNREMISVHLNTEIRNWKLEIKHSHTNFQFSLVAYFRLMVGKVTH